MPMFSLNGIDINYRDEGEGDVVLLVHNLTSNIEGFDLNISELSKHYRVIAADLRGHGLTTHVEDLDEAKQFYTFDNLVDDQLAVLDHLGIDRFYLFGQAFWGANTALHLFQRIPDRVLGMVVSSASMILCDETHRPYDVLGDAGKANFLRMHKLAREEGMMAVYRDRLEFGQFWGPKVLNSPDILKVFTKAHELTSAAAFVTPPELTLSRREAISTELKSSQIPLMLLLGEDENPHHRQFFIDEMTRDCPQLHVMLIPGSGHYPTIENPRDFNGALLHFYAGVAAYNRKPAARKNEAFA